MDQACVRLGQDEKAVRSWKRSAKIFALIHQAPELPETMKILRETLQKTALDISVTEAFIERWHKKGLREKPCKD